MAATTQEQLDKINDAIARVGAGMQSYRSPDGTMVQYAPLSELLKAKRELEALLVQDNQGGVYVGISFGRAT